MSDLDNVWGDTPDEGKDDAKTSSAHDYEEGPGTFDSGFESSTLDAETAEPVKRKKNPAVLAVIVLVALSVLGGAAYTGLSLYHAIVPPKQDAAVQAPAGLEFDAKPSESTGGVPVGKAAEGASAFPGSESSVPTPAASAPAVNAQSVVAVAPVAAVVPDAGVVKAIPASPQSMDPSIASKDLQQCRTDCASKTQAMEAENKRLKDELDELKKPKVAKHAKPIKSSIATPAKTNFHKSTKKRKSPVKTATSGDKDVITDTPSKEIVVPSSSAGGWIGDYKILSIHPKTGPHQQAWVQNNKGVVTIVAAGDMLAGALVKKVDFDSYSVDTSKGRVK